MATSDINTEQLKKEVKEELLKREIMMSLEDEEIDLFEFLAVLKKYWKTLVFVPLLVAILVACYSLIMPDYYKASGSIFVHSSSGGLTSLMNSMPLASFGLVNSGGGGANYLTVFLKSVTMRDYMVKHFGIATNPAIVGDSPLGATRPYEEILDIADKIVTVDNDAKTGLITISAETLSATTSAEIVSAHIERLEKFSKGPEKQKRIFVEKQLEKISKELEVAENAYKDFQDKYKMFALDKQTSAAIDKLALLESQRIGSNISLEMQQSVLKSSGSVPELVRLEAQKVAEEAKAETIKKEMEEMEKELASLPDVSMEFLRLQRTLKVKEKLYAVVAEQYEMAKINESQEGSQFEVIDKPRVPDVKSKPKRSIMVILAALSSGVLAVFFIFLKELLSRRREQEKVSLS